MQHHQTWQSLERWTRKSSLLIGIFQKFMSRHVMHIYQPPSKKNWRKKKIRTVNSSLGESIFQPLESDSQKAIMVLTHDEIESLRLKAIMWYNIIEWAVQMNIGKSTFANTYNSAVRKITEAILDGKIIYIDSVDEQAFAEPVL